MHEFAQRLVAWQLEHGRHGLPWQVSDPYRVWLSEIMLQQTQVRAVLPYYARFLQRFPTLLSLAAASPDQVMALWSGLGYYSRARNLHRAAQMVHTTFTGVFPDQREEIERLPGVGRSTAAAIAVFAFGRREAILDGNVRRVLCRVFAIDGVPADKAIASRLWQLAEDLLPQASIGPYTQGLMDLGSMVCKRGRPLCQACPMKGICLAQQQGREMELPVPAPKKALPTRQITLLLALHRGQIFLERRPPSGIWGGLWSLPECSDSLQAEAWLQARGQGDVLPSWPEFEHGFTHFRLIITPQPMTLAVLNPQTVPEEDGRWLPVAEALDAGLPAPVRRMLVQLDADGSL